MSVDRGQLVEVHFVALELVGIAFTAWVFHGECKIFDDLARSKISEEHNIEQLQL